MEPWIVYESRRRRDELHAHVRRKATLVRCRRGRISVRVRIAHAAESLSARLAAFARNVRDDHAS